MARAQGKLSCQAVAKAGTLPPRLARRKVHSAEAIVYDDGALGDALWPRFNGGAEGTRWYYRSLATVFAQVLPRRAGT